MSLRATPSTLNRFVTDRTSSTKIGSNPQANLRTLNRLEAQMVRSLTAAFQQQLPHAPKGQRGDCFQTPQRPTHHGCEVKPRHCHTTPPRPRDACHPQGSLKADKEGVVTTPGGYKIESNEQFGFKITGPDGKSTRVWGDPHVAEGDGGTWDFKRDSTFVLGDGTRVNVSTAPFGNGMTVTSGLEIISGNERVKISDIDKGKGQTGKVTQDGFQHANSFGGKDVFVMGKETDDWSFQGKEVIGSNNGGDSFKLGGDLPAGGARGRPAPGTQASSFAQQMNQLFQRLEGLFAGLPQAASAMPPGQFGTEDLTAPGQDGSWRDRRHQQLHTGFEDIGRMMDVFNRMNELRRDIKLSRGTFTA
ncbi:DUF1521 domain-containing protein [Corallococcus terminator]